MTVIAVSAVYNDAGCLPEFFTCIRRLAEKPSHHIFVTNNCTDGTDTLIDAYPEPHKRISYNLPTNFTSKKGDPYAALAVAWQRGLEEARRYMAEHREVTHALWLDSDIFVDDADAIPRAVGIGKDILCGSYLRNFPEGTRLASTFHADTELLRYLPHLTRGEYYHISDVYAPLMRPYCSSAGFMLVTRELILDRRVNFYPIYKVGPEGRHLQETSPEYGYQLKARTLGYETWLDGSIRMRHYTGYRHRAWRASGDGGYVDFKYGG